IVRGLGERGDARLVEHAALANHVQELVAGDGRRHQSPSGVRHARLTGGAERQAVGPSSTESGADRTGRAKLTKNLAFVSVNGKGYLPIRRHPVATPDP